MTHNEQIPLIPPRRNKATTPNQIAFFDQILAFIKNDAWYTVINHETIKTFENKTGINAYEILAQEFEHYWRCVIEVENVKAIEKELK